MEAWVFFSTPTELGISSRAERRREMKDVERAEQALRASEQRMRLILDSARDFGIFTLDLEGRVTSWNAGARELLGYESEDICGQSAHVIFSPEDVAQGIPESEMRSARETGRGMDERWHRRKDGSYFWASGLMMPLGNEKEGTLEGYLKIIRDRTEQKQAREELEAVKEELERRVSSRNQELQRSRDRLRSLVHELNKIQQMERQRLASELHDDLAQTLAAARMKTAAAIREVGETAAPRSLREAEAMVVEAISSTRNLMSQLSGYRLFEQDDLVAAIRWIVEKMKPTGLTVHLSHNAPRIPLGPDLLMVLYQSVRELLLNVSKHAGTDRASVEIHQSGGSVCLEVRDEGRGFDVLGKDEPPTVEGGFGLLNIQERLRWLDGDVEIESKPGRGTRVRVTVPVERKESGPEAGAAVMTGRLQEETRDLAAGAELITVLLVDDHRIVRDGLRTALDEKPDLLVIGEAADGVEAINKVRELRPQVVVMDINMPRMNGLEATRHLRAEQPDLIIIGLSLHSRGEMARAMLEAGAVAYIPKEAATETLCVTIRNEIEKRRS